MTDAADTGRKVLEALAEGRRRAIEQARKDAVPNERAVRAALDMDILAGNPERGRVARIERAVRGKVRVYVDNEWRDRMTWRGVQKVIERLSCSSTPVRSDSGMESTENAA